MKIKKRHKLRHRSLAKQTLLQNSGFYDSLIGFRRTNNTANKSKTEILQILLKKS